MTHKLVSVIIPNYNSLEFVKETLDSVFNQTYKHIEFIIVDDGSTDGSFEFLSNLNKPNLNLVRNPSKGACAARNYGLYLAKGDFIQFLDADDLLSFDKIEKQLTLLIDNPNKIAVCNTKHFYNNPEDGVICDQEFLYSTTSSSSFLLNLYGANGTLGMVQTSAWLTPRSSILKAGLWDETLSKDQDGEFFCRVLLASEGIVYEPTVMNFYRKHIGGTNIANGKKRIHIQSQLDALVSKEKSLSIVKDTEEFKKAMALQYKFTAIEAWPEFKDISKVCIDKSNGYGGSNYLPVLGGRIIELIKSLFGWKTAKCFRNWIHTNEIFVKTRS